IQSGQISGGMVPKVQSAIEALKAGVRQVTICDLHGLKSDGGTAIL
ncbi:MAG: acetylglutamate kinase, partial [Chloroflexi bacterium]|nr:acetylglutamate kinase [Chloroflexota bacterium]